MGGSGVYSSVLQLSRGSSKASFTLLMSHCVYSGPPGKLIGHPFSHRSLCPQGLGKSSLGHLGLSTECEIPKFLS